MPAAKVDPITTRSSREPIIVNNFILTPLLIDSKRTTRVSKRKRNNIVTFIGTTKIPSFKFIDRGEG